MSGKTWWIDARKNGVYSAMLKNMLGQLEAMFSHHSKINVIRFDLKQTTYTDKNTPNCVISFEVKTSPPTTHILLALIFPAQILITSLIPLV